ncbi:MAG: hypothetical protein CSA62_04095 [Planctomycetota bacterium]|nr:MAG: hypothetical protein CSA62_04095 [Planctomycetota bacterium]
MTPKLAIAGQGKTEAEKRQEWRIAGFSRGCTCCQAPFLAGQVFFSYLRIDAGEKLGFERLDVCTGCWPARALELRQETEAGPIFWRTRRPRDKGASSVVDLVAMRQLFEQLLEDEREEIEALRYVIGLMLARKKAIRVIRAGAGARGDLYFKDPREGRDEQRVRLPVPRLDEETIEALKSQLGEILGS